MSVLSDTGDYLPLANHRIGACLVLSLSYNRSGSGSDECTQWNLFMSDPFSQMILQPFPMTFAGFIRLEQFREPLSSQISQHTIGTPSAVFVICLRRLHVLACLSTLVGNNNIMEMDLDLEKTHHIFLNHSNLLVTD